MSHAGAVQDQAAVPAQTADTPFADSPRVQGQQSQPVADTSEDPDLSADLDTDTASTLAPSTSAFKSEMGESESGDQKFQCFLHCDHLSKIYASLIL